MARALDRGVWGGRGRVLGWQVTDGLVRGGVEKKKKWQRRRGKASDKKAKKAKKKEQKLGRARNGKNGDLGRIQLAYRVHNTLIANAQGAYPTHGPCSPCRKTNQNARLERSCHAQLCNSTAGADQLDTPGLAFELGSGPCWPISVRHFDTKKTGTDINKPVRAQIKRVNLA